MDWGDLSISLPPWSSTSRNLGYKPKNGAIQVLSTRVERDKAFHSTSIDPATALSLTDVELITISEIQWRNIREEIAPPDAPNFDDIIEERAQELQEQRYGLKPVRILTAYDLRKHPLPSIWMPGVYKAQDPNFSGMFNAGGGVYGEDEVLLPAGLKFKTIMQVSATDKGGRPFVFRIRVAR